MSAEEIPLPVHEQMRKMRVRGHRDKTGVLDLAVGDVIYVDRTKWRVQDQPFLARHTGSAGVPAYSEDAQHQTLYLSGRKPVRVIGHIT